MGSAIVELDVFSGRPNPRWTLHVDALAALHRMISLLPQASVEIEAPGQLGYRGVSVWTDEGDALVRLYYVGGGHVFLSREANGPARIDPDRRIEKILLESGIGNVDQALVTDILSAIR